jgi:hypothetical protein
MARGRGGTKPKSVQKSLEQSGQLPTLKKPAETVGKTIKIPGEHWGANCPSADKKKLFLCTIKDFTLLHTFSPTEKGPAMQLIDMGTDGQGGESADPFWVGYPFPFLKFWYETFPLVDSRPTPAAADAVATEEDLTADLASRSIVYDYLEPVSSAKVKGRQVNKFTCKIMTKIMTKSGEMEMVCKGDCTLTGPVRKVDRPLLQARSAGGQTRL